MLYNNTTESRLSSGQNHLLDGMLFFEKLPRCKPSDGLTYAEYEVRSGHEIQREHIKLDASRVFMPLVPAPRCRFRNPATW